jgi:hypothetical protein
MTAARLIVLGVAVLISGCSNRTITQSPAGQVWDGTHMPWFYGEPVGHGAYKLVPGAERALIFRMGDGVQGHRGDIAGQAWFDSDIVEVIKMCSVQDLHVQNEWHFVSVLVRSSPHDRDTVACVKRKASRMFSAGYGPPERGMGDQTAFREFENKAK